MKNVTIRYGISTRTWVGDENATVGMILADQNNRVVCGYGDNVQGLIAGVPQDSSCVCPNGTTLDVENKANEKATS